MSTNYDLIQNTNYYNNKSNIKKIIFIFVSKSSDELKRFFHNL